jgi:hypothetical protein
MPRFVILCHEFPEGHPRATHWDLMFEWGAALRTWAMAGEPLSAGQIDAEQLPDHRVAYLDYEGPVSGGRGTVTRWDAGDYRLEASTENEIRAVLAGSRLCGRLILKKRDASHSWRVGFWAEPSTL